jgi:hypothetical protein
MRTNKEEGVELNAELLLLLTIDLIQVIELHGLGGWYT